MGSEQIEFAGVRALRLQASDGAVAIVLEHGAQVVSWIPRGGSERLYLSPRSAYGDGAAVRGGVPVIFPQFGPRWPLPRHGFARTANWQLVCAEARGAAALGVLRLVDDAASRALWPHPFAAELTVCVQDDRLDIELAVENTGAERLQFSAALHTYFAVAEVEAVRLEGLTGLRYEDLARGGALKLDEQAALAVDEETDRVYFDVSKPLVLREPRRRLMIEQSGFADTVIWNPWQDKGAALADLPAQDFRRFICVEAAQIARPVLLSPGQEWAGRQSLSAS